MAKEIDIEKELYPEKDELIVNKENESISTVIVDAEMDGFIGTFDGEGCIVINTKEYSHITLHSEQMIKMMELIQKAEALYNDMNV